MIDKTSATEYEALARLSKANRRANVILIALFIVLLIGAVAGGISLYKAQRASFDKQTAQRTKNTANALKEYRTIAVETVRYLTCLNILPVDERTPAAQRDCFRQADLPGGLTQDDFVTVPPDRVVLAPAAAGSNQGFSSSSSNSPTPSSSSQPDNSQSSSTTPDNRGTVKKILDLINPFN